MHKTCPKCLHVNAAATGAADEECPSCGVIYAKAKPRTVSGRVARPAVVQASAAAAGAQTAPPSLPLRQRAAGLAIVAALVGIVWVAFSAPRGDTAPAQPHDADAQAAAQPHHADVQAAAQRLVQREQAQRLADGAAADAMRDYVRLAAQSSPVEQCAQAYVVLLLVQRTGRSDLLQEWQHRERTVCAEAGMASSQR